MAKCMIAAGKVKGTKDPHWEMFTKRTNDPKLAWLERQLDAAGIRHRRNGESFHAPILEVPKAKLGAAWKILDPVDDVPDNDPMFAPDDDEPSPRCGHHPE